MLFSHLLAGLMVLAIITQLVLFFLRERTTDGTKPEVPVTDNVATTTLPLVPDATRTDVSPDQVDTGMPVALSIFIGVLAVVVAVLIAGALKRRMGNSTEDPWADILGELPRNGVEYWKTRVQQTEDALRHAQTMATHEADRERSWKAERRADLAAGLVHVADLTDAERQNLNIRQNQLGETYANAMMKAMREQNMTDKQLTALYEAHRAALIELRRLNNPKGLGWEEVHQHDEGNEQGGGY